MFLKTVHLLNLRHIATQYCVNIFVTVHVKMTLNSYGELVSCEPFY